MLNRNNSTFFFYFWLVRHRKCCRWLVWSCLVFPLDDIKVFILFVSPPAEAAVLSAISSSKHTLHLQTDTNTNQWCYLIIYRLKKQKEEKRVLLVVVSCSSNPDATACDYHTGSCPAVTQYMWECCWLTKSLKPATFLTSCTGITLTPY